MTVYITDPFAVLAWVQITDMSKFPLGRLVVTQGIAGLMDEGLEPMELVARHAKGDWGDLDKHDTQMNNEALGDDEDGGRLFSSYVTEHGKVWVITESDRSATTVLLPEEY